MTPTPTAPMASSLPVTPVERFLAPLNRFLRIQAASGVVLFVATIVALILANSGAAEAFASIWKTNISVVIGGFRLEGDLGHLIINDGLMVIFFFVVGLEVKRELVEGELRDPRKALLPVFGAAGGIVAPALIYLAIQSEPPATRGWAIPTATDIAFVIGILSLFGRRIPFGLKVFLLTLAIVDDLSAVLIIATIFTESIAWGWLGASAAGFALIMLMNRVGVRRMTAYFFVGAFIWLAFLLSGVHPTVAGVLLGLMTPAKAWIDRDIVADVLEHAWRGIRDVSSAGSSLDLVDVRLAASETMSPLHRLHDTLHLWVAFGIMPLFALANAGAPVDPSGLSNPVAIAVAAGLVIGKPLGIFLACFLAVRVGLTQRPEGVGWGMLFGGAVLAGVGFTMSLFLNTLAFPISQFPEEEVAGKVGVLLGSLVSAVGGAAVLSYCAFSCDRLADQAAPSRS